MQLVIPHFFETYSEYEYLYWRNYQQIAQVNDLFYWEDCTESVSNHVNNLDHGNYERPIDEWLGRGSESPVNISSMLKEQVCDGIEILHYNVCD